MSRRRTRTRAADATATPVRTEAAPSAGVVAAPTMPSGVDEIHQRALAVREYRQGRGTRPAGVEAPRAVASAEGTVVTVFPVMGMTCRSCEVRIDKFVRRIPNVERVSASAVKGQVSVESRGPVSAVVVERAINNAGYQIGRTAWLASDPRIWATAGLGVLLVAAIAVAASVAGIDDLANGAGDISQGGLVVALLLGLAAGVSTCMALVGGLVLGLAAAFDAGRPAGTSNAARMRPAVVFVAGRVVGYALFGAVLGAIGASVAMPPQLTAGLMIGVAVVMLLLGTRLTGLSPRIASWSPTLPMGIGRRLGLGAESGVSAYSDARAASLGALSFFLPCGFTQAIQIFALSTGSPLYGAALLGVFALGTAPGLLALGGLPLLVPSRAKPTLLRLVGVVVVGFAVLNGSAGLRLSGVELPSIVGVTRAAQPEPGVLGADGVQRITTYQEAAGYSPANVVVYAGYPVEWTMESLTTAGCAASLWAPGVGIRARLELGPNVFRLPELPVGEINYTCAMGMYGGRITIVPAPADAAVPGQSATTAAGDGPAPAAVATAGAAATSSPAPSATPATASPDPMDAPWGAAGPGTPTAATQATPPAQATEAPSPARQELWTAQEEGGYSPRVAKITAGIPTTWHIESKSQYSCAAYVWVPELEIEKILEPGDNVIELPALEAGTLQYMCGMGMFSALIQVEPAT